MNSPKENVEHMNSLYETRRLKIHILRAAKNADLVRRPQIFVAQGVGFRVSGLEFRGESLGCRGNNLRTTTSQKCTAVPGRARI